MHTPSIHASRVFVCTAMASVLFGAAGCASDQSGETPETRPAYDSYVALGDSFTAGPGVPPQIQDDPCSRSGANYPSLVAADLGIDDFVDASCSGATTIHLTEPQATFRGATVPPQYDSLHPDTDLVTVGIGGNDIGLVQLAAGCINLSAPPEGVSCAESNSAEGTDRFDDAIDAFAPTYGAIVDEIRRRSPEAHIVFVGYPTGVRDEGCFPEQRVWPRDAAYLQSKIDRLDGAMRDAAETAGVDFVGLRESTKGHDACAAPDDRWIAGLSPTPGSVPLHPNAAGHRNAADQVLAELSD